MQSQTSEKEKRSDLVDLLNKTKFQIFTFLHMYGKLSLTEIAHKLNKSKSTIHEHIKKMKIINCIKEEKRPINFDPALGKPKVFENVYSINPEFGTELEDFVPGFNPENLSNEQAKMILDAFLFVTKIRISNLKIQKQFLEKIINDFDKDPENMKNITEKVILGLSDPSCEIKDHDSDKKIQDNGKNKTIPFISSYMHLSPLQYNMISEKYNQICQLVYSEEFKNITEEEKPIIFMASAIPMKFFIEYLNE